jgi:hypothetical protein
MGNNVGGIPVCRNAERISDKCVSDLYIPVPDMTVIMPVFVPIGTIGVCKNKIV